MGVSGLSIPGRVGNILPDREAGIARVRQPLIYPEARQANGEDLVAEIWAIFVGRAADEWE